MLSFLLMTPHFFSEVHNMNMSTINLNNDLNKMKNLKIQWKMNFNPDSSKHAQKVQEALKDKL